jgi:hypothetical protein
MTKKKFYPDANQNLDFAKMEEDILKFWHDEKIFEKSVAMRNFATELDEDNTSPVVNPCSLKDHKNCRHEKNDQQEHHVNHGRHLEFGLFLVQNGELHALAPAVGAAAAWGGSVAASAT